MKSTDPDQDHVLQGVPKPLVDLLSEICGVVQLGALDGGIPTVEGTVDRDGQSWMCQASVFSDGAVLVAKSVWGDQVPRKQRPAAQTLISRVNWALLAGNAEMDHRDGTVRFRTDLCLLGEPLTGTLAEGLILPNLGTAALLFPHLAAVVEGQEKPEQAAEDLADAAESGAIRLER